MTKKHLLPHLLCSNPPQLQRLPSRLQFIAHYKNKIANKYVLKMWQLATFCCFSSSFSLFMKIPLSILPHLKLCICLHQSKYLLHQSEYLFSFHIHLLSFTSDFTQSLLQHRKFATIFAASEQFLPFFSHSNILSTLTAS